MTKSHQHMRTRANRDEELRGSMLLASMMTVSFGILVFLGMTSSMLADRVRTDRVIQTAKAVQLAHSGVEYALWEINYGGAPLYDGAGWAPQPPTTSETHTYTGVPNLTVTVIDHMTIIGDGNDDQPITISSQGRSPTIRRTVTVQAPPRGAAPPAPPGIFDQILYANGDLSDTIHLDATSGEIVLDGYNSNSSEYNPSNPLPASDVVIMSDNRPFRKTCFDTSTCAPEDAIVAPIIFEGNVKAKVKVVFRTPAPGELPEPGGYKYTKDVTGFANRINTGAGGYFTGTITQEIRATSLGFNTQTKAGLEYDPMDPYDVLDTIDPTYYLDPVYGMNPATDVMVICPGQVVKTDQVIVQDATLVLGCSLDPASPYNCNTPTKNFMDFYGSPKSCAGADPAVQVATLSTATGSPLGPSALSVTGSGQIKVLSKTEIYYNRPGTAAVGLSIGGNGISNEVKKASGARDPKALAIYGGKDGLVSTDTFSTSQALYGTIFNPYADVRFTNTAPLEVQGSINAHSIWTSKTVRIHWDTALKTGGGGGGGGGGGTSCDPASLNYCRPITGSWKLDNW